MLILKYNGTTATMSS